MKKLFICVAVSCVAICAMAQEKPVQASLTPDIAVFGKTTPITGLTLSIWGENPQHALALGFVNGTSGKSGGLSLGLLNYGEDYMGVQWGMLNYTSGRLTGLQGGTINLAGTLSGLQLGVVNIAKKTDCGVQLGFINIIQENTVWFTDCSKDLAPGMIFVNWRF